MPSKEKQKAESQQNRRFIGIDQISAEERNNKFHSKCSRCHELDTFADTDYCEICGQLIFQHITVTQNISE